MDDISKELYEKIKKEFDKAIKSDSELNNISKAIESGNATYKEANEFTKRLTELLAKSVNKYANENTLPNGHFYQNIGDAVLEPLLRQCYEEIAKRCESVQKAINDMAKINIKPQEPEYDEYRSYEVVNRANSFPVYNEEAQKSTEKTMESTNYNYVDKSIQKNAEFQTSAGLTATVTRRYDGVGLHDGKQACQWCLSRAGSNVPYREAKQRGMFERHEGCGCTIEYVSAKGIRTRQYGKGSWYNESERENRINFSKNGNVVYIELDEIKPKSEKQIEAIAERMNAVANKYVPEKIQRWQGEIEYHSERNAIDYSGKLYVKDKVNQHIILHEFLHGKSAAWYDSKTYEFYQVIEEGSVQFLAEEISKIENLTIASGGWSYEADILRNIGHFLGKNNDYDFAKELFIIDMSDRIDWLIEQTLKANLEESTMIRISKEIEKLR